MKKISILFLAFLIMNMNAQTESDAMLPSQKWSMTIMPSAGLAYLTSDKTTKKIDSMGFHRQAIASYGFALSASYKLKRRISINAGMQYLVNGYFKFIDPLVILFPGQNPGNELNHYTRINHLNIPVSVDFVLSKNNKFKYGIGTFLGLNLGTKTKIEYINSAPNVNTTNLEKFHTDFGISNSLSYSFRISPSIEIPLKANYNLGIKNISTSNEKLRTSNFQLGLGVQFLL